MSTNKGCAPGKSSLIGLGSARDYDGCAILQESEIRCTQQKKTLRGTRGNSQVYVNEHLTKRNSEIFAKGRKLFKEKKIAAIWTWNGSVFLKRTESSRPVRIQELEVLEMLI